MGPRTHRKNLKGLHTIYLFYRVQFKNTLYFTFSSKREPEAQGPNRNLEGLPKAQGPHKDTSRVYKGSKQRFNATFWLLMLKLCIFCQKTSFIDESQGPKAYSVTQRAYLPKKITQLPHYRLNLNV